MKKGKLYLLPVTISDEPISNSITANEIEIVNQLEVFICEEIRSCRRFIRKCNPQRDLEQIRIFVLNEHSDKSGIPALLNPLLEGFNVGLMSEAGCPGIADPGAEIVKLAHQKGIRVYPLPGPSSIFLSLMASGFNGQSFTFHGYLPKDKQERFRKLKELENAAWKTGYTQLFMEAPYKNNQLVEDAMNLNPQTLLLISADVLGQSEYIRVMPIENWAKNKPDLHKKPCIFGISKP